MVQDEVCGWLQHEQDVPRETIERIADWVEFLRAENRRQNLVAASTLDDIWNRHILDSAQLLRFAPPGGWLDLGSGAGFPGLVIAALTERSVTLVEARRLRCAFLAESAIRLGCSARVRVECDRIERIEAREFSVISARAFAPLPKLLALAHRFSTPSTVWILPKGRNAATELEAAGASWQGDFELEPSLTDAQAKIVVARNVRPRGKVSR